MFVNVNDGYRQGVFPAARRCRGSRPNNFLGLEDEHKAFERYRTIRAREQDYM